VVGVTTLNRVLPETLQDHQILLTYLVVVGYSIHQCVLYHHVHHFLLVAYVTHKQHVDGAVMVINVLTEHQQDQLPKLIIVQIGYLMKLIVMEQLPKVLVQVLQFLCWSQF